MFRVIENSPLAQGINRLIISAPDVAAKARPGQFVILRVDKQGERIPLTLADWEQKNGTITVIVQQVGLTTTLLCRQKKGSQLAVVLGPLGRPTEIKNYGRMVFVAGGVGAAEILPVIKGFRNLGNKVSTILGARSRDLLILTGELKTLSDRLVITTDDGTAGQKGLVTDALRDLILQKEKIDHIYAIGPVVMMEAVSGLARMHQIPVTVSLNPIMVDGTGLCGACRVKVAGRTLFACVDGPEFSGLGPGLLRSKSKRYLVKIFYPLIRWAFAHLYSFGNL
jgi:ferredoxin--NADP+ reductase